MPTATITFNIDLDTEEKYLFKFLLSAQDFYLAVYNYDMMLRNTLKYNQQNNNEDFLTGVEFARDGLREYLSTYDVDLEMLP